MAAQGQCQSKGGQLASPVSQPEQEALEEVTGDAGSSVWIGVNDRAAEGSWVTSSGVPLAFTNWCSGEPNNLGDEDCGELVCWRDRPCGCWNDGRCYADLLYVCEKPQQRGAELQGLAPVFHGSFPEAEGAYALWLLEPVPPRKPRACTSLGRLMLGCWCGRAEMPRLPSTAGAWRRIPLSGWAGMAQTKTT